MAVGNRTAVAALVEHAVRMTGRQEKISTSFPAVSDLIRDDGPVLRKIRLTIALNEDESLFQMTTYRHLYE